MLKAFTPCHSKYNKYKVYHFLSFLDFIHSDHALAALCVATATFQLLFFLISCVILRRAFVQIPYYKHMLRRYKSEV